MQSSERTSLNRPESASRVVFVRLAIIVLVPVVAIYALVSLLRYGDLVSLQSVQSGVLVLKDNETTKLIDVALPHNYSQHLNFSYGEYRISLPKVDKDSNATTAIFLPPFRDTAEFYLGEQLIWQTAPIAHSRDSMMPRFRYRPSYHELPNSLFYGDELSLTVKIASSGGLQMPEIFYGTPEQVKPYYQFQYWSQIGLHIVMQWLTPLITLFYLLLWWFRRNNTEYLFFALGFACWAMSNMTFTVSSLPISQQTYWMTTVTVQPFLTLFMILFLHRWYQLKRPSVELIISVATMVLAASSFVLYEYEPTKLWWRFNESALRGYVALSSVYIGYVLVTQALFNRSKSALLLATAGMIGVVSGILDSLDGMQLLEMHFPLSAHANLLIFLTLCVLLIYRYASALNRSEELQRTLEQKVVEAVALYKKEQAVAHDLEKKQALMDERQSLLSDMHDGLGSQLVELITLLRVPNTNQTDIQLKATQCLNDLRLILDSRNPLFDAQFSVLLGQWRARIEPVLQAANIELEWFVECEDSAVTLTPQSKLDLLRILQELITNVIKHAEQATKVSFQCIQNNSELIIRVQDNGKNSKDSVDKKSDGYGLSSIQNRAKKMNGEFDFELKKEGGIAKVTVPL
ncbi:putative Signal transduction histidine kinase [Vibrio nigripulchritudo SO65]|uniref:sensor histidine kinase n=1 Tax=Vibrio nigripulchritudo TaxID=28173 RepID=UPI0003B1EFE4|nr:ATP-binding protein [Vibrio nigripulchritudo]CCN37799.1 putative Signal transduction histidine kinase [Vibrio nigripulchritudo AM115]CCN44777.1 putative Signal transduction histidine kinase [Vibrio nigripulchritudo FTn2]CCN62903.1 putative Signal transduction histidine kinase [Vibrio nigripulchritudo POn4]CCN77881.1 putative Signal transduction histidine kinase [Vibrio nigripulchritudo SO65]